MRNGSESKVFRRIGKASIVDIPPTSSGSAGVLFQIQKARDEVGGYSPKPIAPLKYSNKWLPSFLLFKPIYLHTSSGVLPSSQISVKLFLVSPFLILCTNRSGLSGFLQSQQLSPGVGTRLARSC